MTATPADPRHQASARLLEIFADDLEDSAIVLLHPDGRVATWTAAAERVEGYTAGEIIGRPMSRFFPAQDVARGRPDEMLETAARTGRCAERGWRVRKDGARYWASVTLTRLTDERGAVTGFARVVRDMTQEHAATVALRESEERFRTMANCAPVLLWMAGTDALCNFFNEFWLEFSGRTMAQEMGNGWAEGVHAEDFQGCMDTFMTAFVERRSFVMEYRLRRADGEYRWIYDQGVPRFGPDGTFAGYIGSCIDITELRRAREALHEMNDELERRIRARTGELTAMLEEREILLREVHHRVKNNLQLISSLLNMQARQVAEPASRNALRECESRVQTIALIHERLYRSKDLGKIPFSQYARSLAANVFHATGVSPMEISLDVNIEEVTLPLDRSIPCGLILNELITNAVKHAFPDARTGTIRVEMCQRSPGAITLVVSDDGVGLPPELSVHDTSSMGLQLVTALAEQLDGELAVERGGGRGGGTSFRLTFPDGDTAGHAS